MDDRLSQKHPSPQLLHTEDETKNDGNDGDDEDVDMDEPKDNNIDNPDGRNKYLHENYLDSKHARTRDPGSGNARGRAQQMAAMAASNRMQSKLKPVKSTTDPNKKM